MFALLISRHGPGPAASHAAREQWIRGNKMIVHLSDTRVLEMLNCAPRAAIRKRSSAANRRLQNVTLTPRALDREPAKLTINAPR